MDDDEKYTCFYNYCCEGNNKQVEDLLQKGEIDLHHDFFNTNPIGNIFSYPVKFENMEMLKILLKYGANLKTINEKHLGIMNLLLLDKVASDLDVLDESFYLAVKNLKLDKYYQTVDYREALDIVKLLFDHKKHVSVQLFLDYAVDKGDVGLLKVLIEKGVDVDSKCSSALYVACVNNNFQVVEILLKSGADPNMQMHDGNGSYPLMCTSDTFIMEALLKFGADINGRDNKGKTALYYCKDEDQMRFLISRGIDTDIRDNNKQTVKDFFESCQIDIVDLSSFYKEMLRCYKRSMEEISKMKSTTLNNYGLTLHDVLLMNRHKIVPYVDNVILKTVLEDPKFFENFPTFGRDLKKKFEHGEERRKLITSAAQRLENLTGFKIPELVVNEFFKYYSNGEVTRRF